MHVLNAQPDNAKKNRYINALPYDHARVVINEYANMNNSDYINASTIVRALGEPLSIASVSVVCVC